MPPLLRLVAGAWQPRGRGATEQLPNWCAAGGAACAEGTSFSASAARPATRGETRLLRGHSPHTTPGAPGRGGGAAPAARVGQDGMRRQRGAHGALGTTLPTYTHWKDSRA